LRHFLSSRGEWTGLALSICFALRMCSLVGFPAVVSHPPRRGGVVSVFFVGGDRREDMYDRRIVGERTGILSLREIGPKSALFCFPSVFFSHPIFH
jgi:hypothetical protein